jgi:hypothetical protein
VVLETNVERDLVFIQIDSEINIDPGIQIIATSFLEFFFGWLCCAPVVVISIGVEMEIAILKDSESQNTVPRSLVIFVFVLGWVVNRESKHQTVFSFQFIVIEFEPSSYGIFR